MTASSATRGKLFIVATPIGNLDDLTPRAREVLAAADVIAAEDTRHTRGLLSRIGVEARLIAYHEHNERERVPELLERLASGATVALVSDAGTPLISDPGWRLVRVRARARHRCRARAGPERGHRSALLRRPPDRSFRVRRIPAAHATARERHACASCAPSAARSFFYESVHRLPETLAALIEHFGVEREAVLARELTKIHEQIRSGTLGELAASLGADVPLLGEFVLVVAGSASDDSPDDRPRAGNLRDARRRARSCRRLCSSRRR